MHKHTLCNVFITQGHIIYNHPTWSGLTQWWNDVMQWGIKAEEEGLKGEVGGFAWRIVLLRPSPFSLSPFSPLPPTTGRISPLSDELAFTVEMWNQFVRKVLMTNLHRRNFNFFIRKSSQIYCSVQTNPYLLAAMCEACGQLALALLLLVGLLVHTYIIWLYHNILHVHVHAVMSYVSCHSITVRMTI